MLANEQVLRIVENYMTYCFHHIVYRQGLFGHCSRRCFTTQVFHPQYQGLISTAGLFLLLFNSLFQIPINRKQIIASAPFPLFQLFLPRIL